MSDAAILQTILGSIEEVRAEMRSGLDQVRSGLDEVRAGLDEVRAGLDEVRVQLAQVMAEQQAIRAELAQLRTELNEVHSEQGLLRDEIAHVRADLAKVLERIEALELAVEGLKGDITVNYGDQQRVERIARSASEEVRALSEVVSGIRRQIHKLQSDVDTLRGGPKH